jgi:hypothetical protein
MTEIASRLYGIRMTTRARAAGSLPSKRITSNARSTSGIVVDDLAAATAFFVGLRLRLQVEGGWVVW